MIIQYLTKSYVPSKIFILQIEMNKYRLKGREIVLKLAQPKERGRGGGRGYSSRGGSYSGGSGFGNRPRYSSNFGQQSSFAPAIPNPQIYGANHGMAGFGAPVQPYNTMGAQAPYGSSQVIVICQEILIH